jgi:YggT family protein
MIIFSNFLFAIAQILAILIKTVIILVFIRAIVSWVNPDPYNGLVRFLNSSTEPFLAPIRRYLPQLSQRVDLSPLLLILALYFLQYFLVGTLIDYSLALKKT